MAIKETIRLIPETHSVSHLFEDHFGHRHEVIYPTHRAKDGRGKKWPAGKAVLEPFDPEPQLENVRALMATREQAFLKHCLDRPHLANHPKVLSHPDHPEKKKPEPDPGVCCA